MVIRLFLKSGKRHRYTEPLRHKAPLTTEKTMLLLGQLQVGLLGLRSGARGAHWSAALSASLLEPTVSVPPKSPVEPSGFLGIFDGMTCDATVVGCIVTVLALLLYLTVFDFKNAKPETEFGNIAFYLGAVFGAVTAGALGVDCFWQLVHTKPITITRSQCGAVLVLSLASALVTAMKARALYRLAKANKAASASPP